MSLTSVGLVRCLSGHSSDIMVGMFDSRDVGVLGEFHRELGSELDTRADGGVRVNDNRDGRFVGELGISSEMSSESMAGSAHLGEEPVECFRSHMLGKVRRRKCQRILRPCFRCILCQ